MIKHYVVERLSWIALFLFIHILILFVAFVDPAVPALPILYIVLLSSIVFILFIVIRFHKETKFYKTLLEWDHDLDITKIAVPESPFEKIIAESLTDQTFYLKSLANENKVALEQEKDELLAWIHEVKTPLTTMQLMIERIEDKKLKENMKYEWLRIHHLLDQQLHQRRIAWIENDLYIEEIDLNKLLISEIKPLQSWCLQKGIGFDLDLETKTVLSDSKWLSFIIRQLLTNAVKYSSDSEILIHSNEKNGQVVVEIKDYGRGIDPRDLPRVFEKGFTSTTHHQNHAATGMGLFLAKKAAGSLHIQIDLQSEIGKGSTFSLTFPKKNEVLQFQDTAGKLSLTGM